MNCRLLARNIKQDELGSPVRLTELRSGRQTLYGYDEFGGNLFGKIAAAVLAGGLSAGGNNELTGSGSFENGYIGGAINSSLVFSLMQWVEVL